MNWHALLNKQDILFSNERNINILETRHFGRLACAELFLYRKGKITTSSFRCSPVCFSKSMRLVIALMIAAFLAHQVTALWDVSYAVTRRYVSPIEQHVHSFLEMIPLMAGAFVVVLNWPQFLALFGLDNESPRCAP